MIELRNRRKGEIQDATISAKKPKNDLTFRKLIITIKIVVTNLEIIQPPPPR
jgi:hypothetical protein